MDKEMQDIQMRELEESDKEQFHDIIREFFEYANNEQLSSNLIDKLFQKALNKETNYHIYCAVDNKQVLGIISVTYGESSYKVCPFAWCDDLFVKKEARRKGIGRLLIQKISEVAKDAGCSNILIGVGKDEQNAIAFYENNGFHDMNCRLYSRKLI